MSNSAIVYPPPPTFFFKVFCQITNHLKWSYVPSSAKDITWKSNEDQSQQRLVLEVYKTVSKQYTCCKTQAYHYTFQHIHTCIGALLERFQCHCHLHIFNDIKRLKTLFLESNQDSVRLKTENRLTRIMRSLSKDNSKSRTARSTTALNQGP